MEENNENNNKKSGKRISITTLIGIFLILIALVGFLSASPGITNSNNFGGAFKVITYIFAYPVLYLFGFVGYWILYPGLLIYGMIILFRNRMVPIHINTSFFGYILLVIFFCIGFSQIIAVPSGLDELTLSNCVGQFNNVFNSSSNNFMFNYGLGGGVVGFFFAGLLNNIASWLLWLVFALGMVISLILVFHLQLKALFFKIRDNRKDKKNSSLSTKNKIDDPKDYASSSNEINNFETKSIDLTDNLDNKIYDNKPLENDTSEKEAQLSEDNYNFQIKSFNKTHGLKKAMIYYDDDPENPINKSKPSLSNSLNVPAINKDDNQNIEVVTPIAPKKDSVETNIVNKPVANSNPKKESNVPFEQIVEDKIVKKGIDIAPVKVTNKKYIYPPLDLLDEHDNSDTIAKNEKYCDQIKGNINDILSTFNIGASIVSYTIGPSVTRYDLVCKDDTSVSAITKLIRDISIRLGGIPMRFEELVVGKPTSGLEIANKTSSTVGLKECMVALPKIDKKTSFSVCFGKDISSDYKICSIKKFPHLLVGGTTGSGKSIFIHTIIMTLIMRNSPDDLRLVLIDPKHVELSKYRDIPHLLCPVIVEPVHAKVALSKLCDEMNRRYGLFENEFVSDIDQYNDLMVSKNEKKLPVIVCVIDEYADLKENCKDVDLYVSLLGGKARASGIHLIVATQRPTTDVISGTIKANLLTRVALAVSSGLDSRVILDQNGAEELLGNGDMLISCTPMARGYLVRCQGSFVSGSEIYKVCNFLKQQGPVEYDENFLDLEDHSNDRDEVDISSIDSGIRNNKDQESEDFYIMLVSNIVLRDYASMSSIQRDFNIGFNRAGRFMNRLTKDGVVSSEKEANKGCRVLIHSMDDYYANLNKNNNGSDSNNESEGM